MNLIVIIAALALGWLGTLAVERYAPRLGLVQAPNERSSHTRPTPRGGGLAIAIAIVLSAIVLALFGASELWSLALLTAIIAALGFIDDLWDLSPSLRFVVQALVFGSLIWTIGPLPGIALIFDLTFTGVGLAGLVLLVGLWWLNLFNFMDGIDGIAGSQAILLLVCSSLIWASVDAEAIQSPIFMLSLAGALATVGFLLRNWPPARIFMGDAGSNALALFIFAVALTTVASGKLSYQSWSILPAVFVADATVTLIRRVARGERPWHAHRQHIYQHLSRNWGHRRVTLLYCALTALWAFPLALAAQHLPSFGWWLALLAYLPLLAFAIRANPNNTKGL